MTPPPVNDVFERETMEVDRPSPPLEDFRSCRSNVEKRLFFLPPNHTQKGSVEDFCRKHTPRRRYYSFGVDLFMMLRHRQ